MSIELEYQDSKQFQERSNNICEMESERMNLKLQIDSMVEWVKKERSGLGSTKNIISLEEVEKKILNLKQVYKKMIRKYNKEMLSKGQVRSLTKRIRFDDEAKAPPRQEWQAIDQEQEEFIAELFSIL